jgi:hypothetical protein
MMLLMRHHLLSFLGLGFGTLLLAGCTTPLSPQSSPTPSGMTSQAETTEFAAIAAAQQSGQPFVCAVQAKDNSVRTEYIVSGQMMKATTIMRLKTSPPPTSGQKTTTSYFLRDASFMYIWSDDKETGVKFPVQSMESMKGRLQESGQQVPELPDFSQEEKQKQLIDQGYIVNCRLGSVTEADFKSPSHISFTDMSALIDQAAKAQEILKQGGTGASGMSQDDLNTLMEQYKQQY